MQNPRVAVADASAATENVPLEVAPEPSASLTGHRRSLRALTGIRFFAAFYVVIFHTRVAATMESHGLHALGNFFANGFLAVPLFFLLSGFILSYTYRGQIERTGDHRRFWEARFSRIWPVYMVSLLLSSVSGMPAPPPGSALATILMVQAWNPFDLGMAAAWNFVCWTLSVEAVFYLVFPWVQVWLEQRSTRATALWVGGMIALCILINSTQHTISYTPHGLARWIPLPIPHLPEFFTGVGLGNLFLARRSLILPGRGLFTYGSAAASLALLCVAPGPLSSVIVAAFAALLYGLAAESTLLSRFLSTPLMLLGGGISYSLYLVQVPVKYQVQGLTERFHLHSESVRFVISTLALLLVSLILFKGVEDPARKLLRGMFARLEARRDAQARRREAT